MKDIIKSKESLSNCQLARRLSKLNHLRRKHRKMAIQADKDGDQPTLFKHLSKIASVDRLRARVIKELDAYRLSELSGEAA